MRCQSCGMPLGVFQGKANYGTNPDGSDSSEYCKFCFRTGYFTEPGLTVDGMIEKSVKHMMQELKFSKEKAEALATESIPKLKRWVKDEEQRKNRE